MKCFLGVLHFAQMKNLSCWFRIFLKSFVLPNRNKHRNKKQIPNQTKLVVATPTQRRSAQKERINCDKTKQSPLLCVHHA
jgi:hypothetical protein